MQLNDLVGILGVGLILVAYFFNLNAIIKKDGQLFFALNISGSLLAAIASYLIHYWPFVILESTWCMISIISLIKLLNPSRPGNARDN